MTALERAAKFADLAMLVYRAEQRYKSKPTKINLERWLKLSREYSLQLRERQDEARNRHEN